MAACILARICRARLVLRVAAPSPFLAFNQVAATWVAAETYRINISQPAVEWTAGPGLAIGRGCRVGGMSDIAEARATALVLRATAKAVRAEQGSLMFRLNRAADVLDAMVALAVRCLERIEQLEQELRQLRAGAR